jgi:hypothetical protein
MYIRVYLIRYGYDVYDRVWMPTDNSYFKATDLSTSLPIDSQAHNDYQPPSVVMSTAVTPINGSAPLEFNWDSDAKTSEYYIYIHFAEVVKLEANQSRSFNITLNGKYWYGPLVPDYLSTTTLYSPSAITGSKKYEFSIFKTETSTLPPILNAIEIYSVKYFLQSETDQGDGTYMLLITIYMSQFAYIHLTDWDTCYEILVDAIAKIKSTYGITINWQGDPCAPKAYSWEGLNCSGDGDSTTPPRITSL